MTIKTFSELNVGDTLYLCPTDGRIIQITIEKIIEYGISIRFMGNGYLWSIPSCNYHQAANYDTATLIKEARRISAFKRYCWNRALRKTND